MSRESFRLPFGGVEPVPRHCSYAGAKDASERVGRQCLALLTAYATHGPLTDREAATALGLERTTINARRNELRRRQLVRVCGTVKNTATGVRNTRWGLTTAGEARADQ